LSYFYSVYGLHLCSNLLISRLPESLTSSPVDVHVTFRERPSWVSEPLREEVFYLSPEGDKQGEPRLLIWKSSTRSYFRFVYGDGAEFFVDALGTKVWATWLDKLSLEDALVFLLGPIMGFILRLRGLTLLHASAVAIDNAAIALMGPPGAGKSTTAAAFARLGYSVVSDDIVPLLEIENRFSAQSGYPCVCLWPESVKSLYGSPDALPLLTPTWHKRYLPLGGDKRSFRREPLPLAAIYALWDRDTGPTCPFVEPAAAAEVLIALVSNTYMNYLSDLEMLAREFDFMGRLAQAVPVRRVVSHTDPAYLDKLCEVIVEDVRKLKILEGGARLISGRYLA
jgi:hypothetical protein